MAVVRIGAGYGFGIALIAMILLLAQFLWARFHARQDIGTDAAAWYRAYLGRMNFGEILAAFSALVVTTACFSVHKATAVASQGYDWDALFITWDRRLFGGTDPWVHSHGLFSTPTATKIIDIFYHPAFLPMVLAYIVCFGAQRRADLRYTYMVSYLACTVIVGMIMAKALHSAGPIYDGKIFGDGTTFGPLIARLAEQDAQAGPFSSVRAQEYLLTLYNRGITGLGGGISAMPSMHMIYAFLWVFGAWHLGRALGIIVTIYAVFIWIGSVHLGWHYFVDGLVSLFVLAIVWAFAGRIFGLYGPNQVIRATT